MIDVLDKIRKLLALATSPNEHEAALAASMAAELMLKHQISRSQLESDAEGIEQLPIEMTKRMAPWRLILLTGITYAIGCKVLTFTTLNKEVRKKKWRVVGREIRIEVVGRATEVAAAKYMYGYFRAEIERLADASLLARQIDARRLGVRAPRSLAYMNAFRLGAASLIHDRLVADRDQRLGAARGQATDDPGLAQALIRLDADAARLEDYLRSHGFHEVEQRAAAYSETLGMADGENAGKEVDLGGHKTPLPAPPARLKGGSNVA